MNGRHFLQALTLLQRYVSITADIGLFVANDQVYVGTDIKPAKLSIVDRMTMEKMGFEWDNEARAWRYSC